jgi:putative restriction endonuclease
LEQEATNDIEVLSAGKSREVIYSEPVGIKDQTINYWWVNQNKTWRQEQAGGYMWSPKLKKNLTRNPYYDFMTEVSPRDIVFSFVERRIVAIGVATSGAYSSPKPKDFGSAGHAWSEEGWRVNVEFQKLESPLEPRNHMQLLGPLLPERHKPLKINGDGQELYLTSVNHELAFALLDLIGNPEIYWPITDLSQIDFVAVEQELILDASLTETEKASLVMSRRGQGSFRERVRIFEEKCRVTGVRESELLIASHIKPWKDSNNDERLNGHNGLFLSPHVDKLFDLGFITFEDSGKLVSSPLLDLDVLDRWHIARNTKVKPFDSVQSYFLNHHREKVFRAA